MTKKTYSVGQAFLLPDGSIVYPATHMDGNLMATVHETALPGTPEHEEWKPHAIPAPDGMFTGQDTEEADAPVEGE